LGLIPFARTLCLLPTHFGHGLICNCLFPWLSGQDLFITPPFRPDIIMRLGRLLDDHHITFMSSVPSIWKLALKLANRRRPAACNGCIAARRRCRRIWEDIRTWTGTRQVCNAYGITETGSWVVGLSNDADCAAEDGLVGEGWGAVVKVLRTANQCAARPMTNAPWESPAMSGSTRRR
jgi:acyl-CoA synthetase (AMP-forming)/AMP-acid ligase II